MPKSINEWLAEGEELYTSTLSEYQELEQQIHDLEEQLSTKLDEVNRLARIISRPPVEGRKVLKAEIVGSEMGGPGNIPNSPATIARALTGRGLGR